MKKLKLFKKTNGHSLYTFIFLLSALVFLVSLVRISVLLIEDRESGAIHKSLIAIGVEKNPVADSEEMVTEQIDLFAPSTSTEEETTKKLLYRPDISVDIAKLKTQYRDVVGWLYRQDEAYHLPVMQSQDNNYYLRRLPDGESNRAGSLFLDYRDPADQSSWNRFIYGHNMRNKTMFGNLRLYEKQSHYEENPFFFYFSEQGTYRIEIIAAVRVAIDSPLFGRPQTDLEKEAYLSLALNKSMIKTKSEVSIQDPLMVFSTCQSSAESDKDLRFLLIGKMVAL